MLVNKYSSRDDQDEDDLLHLCRSCAAQYAARVRWACRGDEESECEFCGASNDEAHSQALDASYAQITGSPAPVRRGARQ